MGTEAVLRDPSCVIKNIKEAVLMITVFLKKTPMNNALEFLLESCSSDAVTHECMELKA